MIERMDLDLVRELSDDGERLIPEDPNSRPMFMAGIRGYRFLLEHLPQEGPVADLGCGEGYGVSILAERSGPVVGIDYNERILRRAADKYRDHSPLFARMNLERLGLKKGVFAGVVSNGVIEHLRDYEGFVSAAWQLLKPGGVLIVVTPNKDRDFDWHSGTDNVHHVKEFSKEEFEPLFRSVCGSAATFCAANCSEKVKHFLRNRRLGEAAVRSVAGMDRFDLRKLLPKPVRRVAENLIRGAKKKAEHDAKTLGDEITTEDYWFSQDFDNCQDLIAICLKPDTEND